MPDAQAYDLNSAMLMGTVQSSSFARKCYNVLDSQFPMEYDPYFLIRKGLKIEILL